MRVDFFFLAVLSSFLISSCSKSKLSQCEQIFEIASRIANSEDVENTNNEESSQIKNWLETALVMDKAASNIQALHISDGKLIGYQNKLATIYRIYSQATYNAVKARESKNLAALELARMEAMKAGEMQQNLIENINNYCLNKSNR